MRLEDNTKVLIFLGTLTLIPILILAVLFEDWLLWSACWLAIQGMISIANILAEILVKWVDA